MEGEMMRKIIEVEQSWGQGLSKVSCAVCGNEKSVLLTHYILFYNETTEFSVFHSFKSEQIFGAKD